MDIEHAGIKLQFQPTATSCVVTCVAMLLGVPVEQLVDKLREFGHPATSLSARSLHRLLLLLQIEFQPLLFPEFIFNGWYLAVVPSLNMPGRNHQVLVNHQNGELLVFDPNPPDKIRYDGGTPLCSWESIIYVEPGGNIHNIR